MLVIAVGVFAVRVAWGLADLAVWLMTRRLGHRWPDRGAPDHGPPGGGGPAPATGGHHNENRGDVYGTVVQAGRIGHLHVHGSPHDPADADG